MSLFNGDNTDQTVTDLYDIDKDTLEELSEINDYWEKSYTFFNQVKNKKYKELTSKQIEWLDRIQADYSTQYERLC